MLNMLILAQLSSPELKLLLDAGQVVILSIVVLVVVAIVKSLVGALIKVMGQYVEALRESNEQTRLMRETLKVMDERQSELMLGNNSIVHIANDKLDKLAGQLTFHDAASRERYTILLHEVRKLQPSSTDKPRENPDDTTSKVFGAELPADPPPGDHPTDPGPGGDGHPGTD